MQRAIDKTDQMQARASAVEELQAAGTFEDLTRARSAAGLQSTASSMELGAKSAVDDELAQLKAEVGPGGQQSALPAGEPAAAAESDAAPSKPGT